MVLTQSKIVRDLRRLQGARSDTEFAATLGISSQYWYMIRTGRRNPGPKVLKFLGVKRVLVQNNNGNGNGTGKKSRH